VSWIVERNDVVNPWQSMTRLHDLSTGMTRRFIEMRSVERACRQIRQRSTLTLNANADDRGR